MIDLGRVLIGFSPKTFEDPDLKEFFYRTLFQASEWNEAWSSPLPKTRETNILLALRTLANGIQEDADLGGSWFSQVGGLPIMHICTRSSVARFLRPLARPSIRF